MIYRVCRNCSRIDLFTDKYKNKSICKPCRKFMEKTQNVAPKKFKDRDSLIVFLTISLPDEYPSIMAEYFADDMIEKGEVILEDSQ